MPPLPSRPAGLLVLLLWLRCQVQGDCPAPARQPYATLRGGPAKGNYPVGTSLRYDCIPGYRFKTGISPVIRCQTNSKWSWESSLCQKKKCRTLAIENGEFEGGLEFGDKITFSCYYGFRLLGDKTAVCVVATGNRVEWDIWVPVICEKVSCYRPLVINNGRHNGDRYFDYYVPGDVITYTCYKDFSLIGHPSITCIITADGNDGKWDRPPPECKVVSCSRPSISDGSLTSPFQRTYKYDHVLEFVCNAGHTLVGSQFVKCGADNQWHPELPTCVKGIFTTTNTTGGGGGNGGSREDTGPTLGSTLRPTSGTTEETITNEAGRSNTRAIVTGVVLCILALATAVTSYVMYKRSHRKEGKGDSHPGTPDPNQDTLMQEEGDPSKPSSTSIDFLP